MKGLKRLFEQAVEADVIPKIFVLCGNFAGGNVSNDVEMEAYKGVCFITDDDYSHS